MTFIIACLSLLICALSIILIITLVRYEKLNKKFNNQNKSLNSILKTINSVRYGNLYEKIDANLSEIIPNFTDSINRMIDAIVDREKMIAEYQLDLNKKIEALKEIEQLKEDFVATLTHDLKVPILAEKNMLAFLIENRFGELNENQKEAIKHLQNSNKELVELVEIILETYKLNETKIELNKECSNIKNLLENAIEEMRPIADTDNITLNFYPGFDKNILIDNFYIKRVFKNLILNAISFSNPQSKIDLSISEYENNVYIKISNYGKAIKKEEIKHVFDKYYTTTKKFRKVGTGLGLYLSNIIIKEHQGEIFIESDENESHKYTTFIIKLPN